MNSSVAQKTEKKTALQKFLDFVEIGGNKLPHPVTLFAMLCVAVAIISAITAAMGIEVTTEIINRATNEMEVQTIKAVSLLNGDGFKYMIENAVSNFTGFAPLGVVLVGMLGIGIAESSGYIGTLLKKVVSITPAKLIVPTVVFLGIMSNMASDAGYVILIPLGALIFMAYGKHPLAGIAAAFAGVSGGFSANLLIGTIDPMLAGLTNEAAHIIDPTVNITPTANYFFMCASTFLITILGTLLTTKVIEPRLGKYEGETITGGSDLQNLSDKEMLMIKEKEGKKILSKIKDNSHVIALAIDGKNLSSEELAETIDKLGIRGISHIVFVIGGSLGLSDEVLKRANYKLSFSKMTFPHQLMRLILLEQVYRAYRINNGEPYHK